MQQGKPGRRTVCEPDQQRQTAQGVEINSREICLIRLSCSVGDDGGNEGARPVRVDDAWRHSLPPGVVVGTDIVDVDTLTRTLAECLVRQSTRLAQRVVKLSNEPQAGARDTRWHGGLAMALCPSVVTQGEVAMEDLMPGFQMCLPRDLDDAAFDALEPWVRLHAQKISGVDPGDLVVDWYRAAPRDAHHLIVATAQRHYLEVRQRVAEGGGSYLCGLGDAGVAALGACRFVVARCVHGWPDGQDTSMLYPLPVQGASFTPSPAGTMEEAASGNLLASETMQQCLAASLATSRLLAGRAFERQVVRPRFGALWLGEEAWRLWTFEANGAALKSVAIPDTLDPNGLLAALREAVPPALELVLVAGNSLALEPVGGLPALGRTLGCPAIEFDASACCVGPASTPSQLGPAAAVAFGMALQELMR